MLELVTTLLFQSILLSLIGIERRINLLCKLTLETSHTQWINGFGTIDDNLPTKDPAGFLIASGITRFIDRFCIERR